MLIFSKSVYAFDEAVNTPIPAPAVSSYSPVFIQSSQFKDITIAQQKADDALKQKNYRGAVSNLNIVAQVFLNRESYKPAEKALLDAITIIDDHRVAMEYLPQFQYFLAYIRYNTSEYEKALGRINKALESVNKGELYYRSLDLKAKILFDLKQNAEFEALYSKIINNPTVSKYVETSEIHVLHAIIKRDFRFAYTRANQLNDEGVRLEALVNLYAASGMYERSNQALCQLDSFNESHMSALRLRDRKDIEQAIGMAKSERELDMLALFKSQLDLQNTILKDDKTKLEMEAASKQISNAQVKLKNDSIEKVNIETNRKTQLLKQEEAKREQEEAYKVRRLSIMGVLTVAILIVMVLVYVLFSIRKINKDNKKLIAAHKAVERSEEQKIQFLQSVSHEIRTPINAILGFAQVMTMGDEILNDKEKKECLDNISTSTESLSKIVDDIHIAASLETNGITPTLQPVIINEFCKSVFEKCSCDSADGVDTVFSSHLPDEFSLNTDKEFLSHIVENLMSNACKYTDEGVIEMTIGRESDNFILSIKDTGIGISAEKAEMIFNKFEKLGSFVQGNGLGLPISRELAELLGGKLFLDTDYTSGSRFVLTLKC